MEKRKKIKKIVPFNVIIGNFNKKTFEPYDIMPYLIDKYKDKKPKDKPKTFEEFKDFVDREAKYQWWSRCEYEILLYPWPNNKDDNGYKLDIYEQIMMNHDLIAELLMFNVGIH